MLLLLTCKPLKMVLGAKSLNQITIPKLLFFNGASEQGKQMAAPGQERDY
jgi:hypothetical protein